MVQSAGLTRSRIIRPEHADAVCAALELDKGKVLSLTTEEIVAALCVAVAKLRGLLSEPVAPQRDAGTE